MHYLFTENALKDLHSLPKLTQKSIFKKLKFYMSAPDSLKLADRLLDFEYGQYRFRIGDYRVSFDVENDTAKILKVGNRKDIYK